MNWNKLAKKINEFGDRYNLLIERSSVVFLSGKITTFRFIEDSIIFYEINHSKPVQDIGSKVRLYSQTNLDVRIESTARWFRKPKIKLSDGVSSKTMELVHELSPILDSFSWRTDIEYLGWPKELNKVKKLVFECSDISRAIQALDQIRQIHLSLMDIEPK